MFTNVQKDAGGSVLKKKGKAIDKFSRRQTDDLFSFLRKSDQMLHCSKC